MADAYGAFRLNFEQQQKRAKDLLRAARAADPAALVRFGSKAPKLAEAQFLIARELRFESWTALKRHIADMALARQSIGRSVLDGDLRTLHIRCGSDLKEPLRAAGFHGDFYEHSYPYLMGPVREGPRCLQQRAQFIVECYGDLFDPPLEYAGQLRSLEDAERALHESAQYERVVIWSEHDCYDQLTLVRLLGHFAQHRCPPQLDLVNTGDFPGSKRFIGLGELPPEALRMLWNSRVLAGPAQLQLGLSAWQALTHADPRPLAAIMRSGTPALPLLARALHRHLRELPSSLNGLSLTEALALDVLAKGPENLIRLIGRLHFERDPLPGQGDWNVRRRVLDMEHVNAPVWVRSAGVDRNGDARPPWTDVMTITDLGNSVLRGEVDFRSLDPAPRWVGGVEIRSGDADWRWDEARLDAVRR